MIWKLCVKDAIKSCIVKMTDNVVYMEKWNMVAFGLIFILVGLIIGVVISQIALTKGFSLDLTDKKIYWVDVSIGGQPHLHCKDFWYSEVADTFSCETDSVAGFDNVGIDFDYTNGSIAGIKDVMQYYDLSSKKVCSHITDSNFDGNWEAVGGIPEYKRW